MGTINPMKGLMAYYYYSSRGIFLFVFALCLGAAAIFLITGQTQAHFFVGMFAISIPAYVIMVSMGYEGAKWERFQITMPVRRKELADSQYIRILLASIVGIPFFVIVTGIGYVLHENLFENPFMSTVVVSTSLLLSHPLILAGLIFPLTFLVKEGGRQDAAIVICVFASIAIWVFLGSVGLDLGLSEETAALLTLSISAAICIVSNLIVRRMYAKGDF